MVQVKRPSQHWAPGCHVGSTLEGHSRWGCDEAAPTVPAARGWGAAGRRSFIPGLGLIVVGPAPQLACTVSCGSGKRLGWLLVGITKCHWVHAGLSRGARREPVLYLPTVRPMLGGKARSSRPMTWPWSRAHGRQPWLSPTPR